MQRIELLKESAQMATQRTLEEMTQRLTYTAGAITIDAKGGIGIHHTSPKMAWAYRRGDRMHSGIRLGDDFVAAVTTDVGGPQ